MRLSWLHKIRREVATLLDQAGGRSEREQSWFQKSLHFAVLVWSSFSRNRCPARASALAFATLLALIPMLALAMSITTSFLKSEGEQRIDHFIAKFVGDVMPRTVLNTNALNSAASTSQPKSPQAAEPDGASGALGNSPPAVVNGANRGRLLPSTAQEIQAARATREMAHRIHEFIQNTRTSTLGVTGTLGLIFAAISLLSQVETAFNDIWGAPQARSLFTQVVLYWTVISLGPLLVAVAVGLTTGPHLEVTQRLLRLMPFLGNLLFKILPVILLCLALALFYRTMPNTKVHWNAALVGGLVAGLLWHLNNLISVLYVSRVVSNSKIYGSLGIVPVFMIGLYFAWWILLFGAQVAYAFQNRASFVEQQQVESIGQRGRELLALRLMAWIGRRFRHGEEPLTVFEMSRELEIPTRLILQIMHALRGARLLIDAAGRDAAYVPARPLGAISCHDILMAMRTVRGRQPEIQQEPAQSRVYLEFRRIEQAAQKVADSVSLEMLAECSRLGLNPPKKKERAAGIAGASNSNEQSLTE